MSSSGFLSDNLDCSFVTLLLRVLTFTVSLFFEFDNKKFGDNAVGVFVNLCGVALPFLLSIGIFIGIGKVFKFFGLVGVSLDRCVMDNSLDDILLFGVRILFS